MDKSDIEGMLDKVLSIIELFDTPEDELSKSENMDLISSMYSDLKNNLRFALDSLKKRDKKGELSALEQAIILPALNEAILELKAKNGSKSEHLICSSLSGCYFILGHYNSQINI
uniref:hypothetical protein n=1 Tax=Marinobacterium profundum TaxID=1714300 RepID=UPI00082C18E1|nr:hypothetical protein [Marinobacterium profundum]